MCLDRVVERYDPPLGERDAWKVLLLEDGELYCPIIRIPLKRGEWIRTGNYRLAANEIRFRPDRPDDPLIFYPAGFHVFTRESDAQLYRKLMELEGEEGLVVRVRIRGVRTRGEQSRSEVLVADELLVPG